MWQGYTFYDDKNVKHKCKNNSHMSILLHSAKHEILRDFVIKIGKLKKKTIWFTAYFPSPNINPPNHSASVS